MDGCGFREILSVHDGGFRIAWNEISEWSGRYSIQPSCWFTTHSSVELVYPCVCILLDGVVVDEESGLRCMLIRHECTYGVRKAAKKRLLVALSNCQRSRIVTGVCDRTVHRLRSLARIFSRETEPHFVPYPSDSPVV